MCASYELKVPRISLSEAELLHLINIVARNGDRLKTALHINCLLIVCSQNWLQFPWFTAGGPCEKAEDRQRLINYLCFLAQMDYPDDLTRWELQWILEDLGLYTPKWKRLLHKLHRGGRDYELSGL